MEQTMRVLARAGRLALLLGFIAGGSSYAQITTRVDDGAAAADVEQQGPCRTCRTGSLDPYRRAGQPQKIAPWAVLTDNHHYDGYFVGGGAAWRGDARREDEGTWGFDYVRLILRKRVDLGWWHGRFRQGGSGAYKTDGPHLHH